MNVIVMDMEMLKKAMFAAIFPPDDEHGTWYISVVEGRGKTEEYELTPLPERSLKDERVTKCCECGYSDSQCRDVLSGKPFCNNWKTYIDSGCFYGRTRK